MGGEMMNKHREDLVIRALRARSSGIAGRRYVRVVYG